MRQMIRGFIFDMDGVIIDNHEFHFKAWMEFAKKYNFELDEEIYRTTFNGKTNADLFKMIFGNITLDQIINYSVEKETNYQNIYLSRMKPHKGVISFLQYLKQNNHKIALGTSAPKSNVDFTLDNLGIRHFFDVIVDGSEVVKGKPDKEVYEKCSQYLKLPPQECIVFEDSIAGLLSGKNAGCHIIGIATSHKKEELAGYVTRILDDFTDLSFLDEFRF